MSQDIRKGSKVQFNIGRGTVTGKVIAFSDDGKIATIESEGRKKLWRKVEKLTRA